MSATKLIGAGWGKIAEWPHDWLTPSTPEQEAILAAHQAAGMSQHGPAGSHDGSHDGGIGWAPAGTPPQPCPCPPCLAARSLDLGYTRENCAYAATIPAPAPVTPSRRNVCAAIRASGRVVDVAAIARACAWDERHTATLAHEWARNDVGCEECAARGTRIGCGGDVYDCPDCDGSGRDLARLGQMILDGAELECGFCSADVEHGDVSCAECGVEFVEVSDEAGKVVAQ